MTPPVTTDALADQIEAKMKSMSLLSGDELRWATHALGSLAYIHSTRIVRALRSEAAHQQVTAERDEARADQKDAEDSNDALNVKLHALAPHGSCACSYDRPGDVCEHHSPFLATANAELARLRAEGEAKDRALKLLLPFVDYAAGEGLMFVETEDDEHPEMDAADLCIAAAKEIGLELGSDASEAFLAAGYDAIRAARAATAREGA